MSYLKPLYLTNNVFYCIGVIFVTFCLAFAWPILMYVGWSFTLILAAALLLDLRTVKEISQNIHAYRKLPRHFSMSDENEVALHLANKNSKEIILQIVDEIPVQFQERNFGLIEKFQAYQKKTINYQLRPLSRGDYHFGQLNLFFRSKRGLIEYRKIITASTTVKVYPSFVQMKKFEIQAFNSDRTALGVRKIRRIGHGYDFSDIRQYVPGDDTRSINWKASSRTGTIMLNNYEDETSQQIYTIIDKSRATRMPFNGLSLMDYAINASLAILNIALKNKDKSGMMAFAKHTEHHVKANTRNDQLPQIMDELYNIASSDYEADFADLQVSLRQQTKSRSVLLLFTNFLSINSFRRSLPHLKRIARNHLLVVIFFENTELTAFKNEPISDTLDLASKILAEKLTAEMDNVIYELRTAGIEAIQTKPEELTTHTVNKYLELKSRGRI